MKVKSCFSGKTAGSTRDAVRVTRERRVDLLERATDRKVFQCLVVGAKDAGKVENLEEFCLVLLILDGLHAIIGRARFNRSSRNWSTAFTIRYQSCSCKGPRQISVIARGERIFVAEVYIGLG